MRIKNSEIQNFINIMKQKPFRTAYNVTPDKGEYNNLPSETRPDQNMTIQQIMKRFAMGLPISSGQEIYFDEEDDFPDTSKMDLADREQLIKELQAEQRQLKREAKLKYDQEQEEKKAADMEALKALSERMKITSEPA